MRTDKRLKLHILLVVLLLAVGFSTVAQGEEPLTLMVEADPDCLLREAGEMTFFRFTVKNDLEENYTLEHMTLQGDLLSAPKLIAESITISANDVLEFTLKNVYIEEDDFDTELSFELTWWTTSYAPEDEEHLHPVVSEHAIAAPVWIERFVEPTMALTASANVQLAREGDVVKVTYTLVNDTKFDMTNITLQDAGVSQRAISLERNVLYAGEQMQATINCEMGSGNLELMPYAQYTVRGVESRASAEQVVTVLHVSVDLKMEIEKYPATAEGTLFRITLINDGSHALTDIHLVDEIGTVYVDGISLKAGKQRTVSCTVPSAVSSGSVRYISFEVTATDIVGGQVTVKSPSAYEVLPFVDSNQVQLRLNVSMGSSDRSDEGYNRLKLLFEIRNDSRVPITNAIITEADYFKSVVNEYAALSTGTTTFEKEFVVPDGTRSLTFVLTAMDPSQTQYAAEPVTLDLSPLTAPKPTPVPAIRPGKTVELSGTIYDTDRFIRLFRMMALIAIALTVMFMLLSLIFRVAELNVRRWLPKDAVVRPFGPRKTPTGPVHARENADPIHDLFGYQQPAKLRYMDRTDRMPALGQEESVEAPAPALQPPVSSISTQPLTGVSRRTNASRREGDITAVPIHKTRKTPVMLTSSDTAPFVPVHDEQGEADPAEAQRENAASAAPAEAASVTPRVIEVKPVPRVIPRKRLEIVRVLQP